ncbi:MAG TPA: helix-turn-helix domain-containing protein [Anaerolineae bacterium]|nr:helix-turn-helix domain-containing protein [Anaerolineae bacterium]HQK13677.1 helix-turn-helix domain-containing protein [Anaerolineae bacterium]
MTLQDYVTIQEGAKLSGYCVTQVRRLVAYGRVAGVKMGRDWFVERAALLAYVEEHARLGRQKFNPWREELVRKGRGRARRKDHDPA